MKTLLAAVLIALGFLLLDSLNDYQTKIVAGAGLLILTVVAIDLAIRKIRRGN